MHKLMVVLILTAVAGVIAGVFTPTPVRSLLDRVLPILMAVTLLPSLGLLILARRLPRRDVSSAERWLRTVFFVKPTGNKPR